MAKDLDFDKHKPSTPPPNVPGKNQGDPTPAYRDDKPVKPGEEGLQKDETGIPIKGAPKVDSPTSDTVKHDVKHQRYGDTPRDQTQHDATDPENAATYLEDEAGVSKDRPHAPGKPSPVPPPRPAGRLSVEQDNSLGATTTDPFDESEASKAAYELAEKAWIQRGGAPSQLLHEAVQLLAQRDQRRGAIDLKAHHEAQQKAQKAQEAARSGGSYQEDDHERREALDRQSRTPGRGGSVVSHR